MADLWFWLDVVSQVGIFVLSLMAIIMLSVFKNKWGNVVGLIQQPFWFFTAIYHGQVGLFLLSIAYVVVWCIGIYQWFNDSHDP